MKAGNNKTSVNPPHSRTSIGKSANSRPKNKHLKRGFKKYRGQGR